MKLYQTILLIIIAVFCSECSTTRRQPKQLNRSDKVDSRATDKQTADEDFTTFYDRFHTDSSFQISRLRFPLEGTNEFGNEWTLDNWNLMKTKIFDVDKTKFKVVHEKTDKLFFQKVWIESSGFKSECKFELIDRKWYLVYDLEFNN